jgi:NAD(P)H-dependent FMN reductase
MSKIKIGIVISTTRATRFGHKPAEWVKSIAAERSDMAVEILKNALDYAYPEWNKKAAALVGYGAVGGSRAVEQLRLVAAELQLATIRTGVYIQGADFMAALKDGKNLKEITHLQQGVRDMLDQLAWWAAALKSARQQDALSVAA